MSEVEIAYCVPCGLLDDAQMAQRHVLTEFGEDLDRVALVTGDAGVFQVGIDDEIVFVSQEQGYDREARLGCVPQEIGRGEVSE